MLDVVDETKDPTLLFNGKRDHFSIALKVCSHISYGIVIVFFTQTQTQENKIKFLVLDKTGANNGRTPRLTSLPSHMLLNFATKQFGIKYIGTSKIRNGLDEF